jgi:hypothetical protein
MAKEIDLLCCISSEIISHLGKNPRNGGSPPNERSIEANTSKLEFSMESQLLEERFKLNFHRILIIIIRRKE